MYTKLRHAISRRRSNKVRDHLQPSDQQSMTRSWRPSEKRQDAIDRKNPALSPRHTDTTARENRERLLKVLDVCTTKLQQRQTRQHEFHTGAACSMVRGKFYGARGIIRDIDFIHQKILIDIKSYKDPIWLSLSEVEPG